MNRAQHEPSRSNRQWNSLIPGSIGANTLSPMINRPLAPRRKEFSYSTFLFYVVYHDNSDKRSPEVGSKLEEKEDREITYVAAGTAPLSRSTPSPPKQKSPDSSPVINTCYAGLFPAPYSPQFDRHSIAVDSAAQKQNYSGGSPTNLPSPLKPRDKRPANFKYDNEQNYRRSGNYRTQNSEESNAMHQLFRVQNQIGSWNRRPDFSYHDRRPPINRGHGSPQRRWERSRSGDVSIVYPQISNPASDSSSINQRIHHDDIQLTEQQRRHRQSIGENEDQMARLLQMMEQQKQQQLQKKAKPVSGDGDNSVSTTNLSGWPVPGATNENKPEPSILMSVLPPSPLKQNYSAVVARNSRSSASDAPPDSKETTPVLYSQKAAYSIHSPGKIHLEPRTDRQKLTTPQKPGTTNNSPEKRQCAAIAIASPTSTPNPIAANDQSNKSDGHLGIATLPSPPPPPSELLDTSGHFEISKMDVLSEQIWHFHNKITQKESTLTRKLSLRDMLYYAISRMFPMCGLYVVGSSLNGFGNDKSDMDLCLMITNKDLDQKTDAVVVLNMILSALQRMEWVTHQKLILAKVPILRIKFASPFSDITVDLNVNNSVAIKNTHLLCYYSSFDWRVKPLVSIVKEWAKRKGINDANRSSFTSYSLVLMVIHYLQCGVEKPVLPSLQLKYPKRFNPRADVRTLNVTQPLINELDWTYQDKTTLGELLLGFLKYYSTKFDYNSQAISIREGKSITRTQVTRSRNAFTSSVTWRSQWRCICIEEPFTFNNTAHSIYDEMVFNAIKKAFEEAHDELEKTRDLDCLLFCKPITATPPIHGATAYVYDGVNREATLEAGVIIHGGGVGPSEFPSFDSNTCINTIESGVVYSTVKNVNEDENDKENVQRPTSIDTQRSFNSSYNHNNGGRYYHNFNRNKNYRRHPNGAQTRQQRGSS